MFHLRLILSVLLSLLAAGSVVLADSADRRHILLDTGKELTGDPLGDLPILTEDGLSASTTVFGGEIHQLGRLPDGTVRIVVKGDFTLGANDTFRGTGNFPVVIEVGDDVEIADGAIIDFAGVETVPGAGGGGARFGGAGGSGGEGGEGGAGGAGGRGGSGGLIVSLPTALPLSATTPGLPAQPGLDGLNGQPGDGGTAGRPGRIGRSPWLAADFFGGNGAPVSTGMPGQAAGNAGAGGAAPSWPPQIYFTNADLRNLLYNPEPEQPFGDFMSETQFVNAFYRGGDSAPGEAGTDQTLDNDDGEGQAGGGGRHPGTGLVGGGGGGSGSGGAGGAGGQGGGGGGGGSGGHGEWGEPLPTNLLDLTSSGADFAAGKLLEKLIKAYVENTRTQNNLIKALNIPTADVGDGGGNGGDGGRGGQGAPGGDGGAGGAGGAGGGALKIVAQGRILVAGSVHANGGDGAPGEAGQPGSTDADPGQAGAPAGETSSGWGMSDVFGVFGNAVGEIAGPEPDRAGEGFSGKAGGQGGVGGTGYPGGQGGGGAGGTLIFEGTEVVGGASGTRRIRIQGGNLGASPATVVGESGRIELGTNTVEPGSDVATALADAGFSIEGTPSAAATGTGTMAGNPFLAGTPATPTIAGLAEGAEAFGETGFLTTNIEATVDDSDAQARVTLPAPGETGDFPTLLQELIDPAVVLGAMRVDRGPRTYPGGPPSFPDYADYDVVLVFNARGTDLSDVHFGCSVQPLDASGDPVLDGDGRAAPFHTASVQDGGWTRDPAFGGGEDDPNGILTGYEIYAFLVPEDPDDGSAGLNFFLSATDDSNPDDVRRYTLQSEVFEVGDYLEASFDPGDVLVEESTWTGGASGNWGDDINWSTTAFPNNSTSLAYNVFINLPGLSTTTVAQDQQVIIDRLEIGANTDINLLDNRSLTIEKFDIRPGAGVIRNDGVIHLNSTGSLTNLFLTGSSMSLEGDGSLDTSNDINNVIAGIRPTDSLVHGANHTIRAAGRLGDDLLRITNLGTIESRNTLVIDPAGTADDPAPNFLNDGTLRLGPDTVELRLADGFFENRGLFEGLDAGRTLSFDAARFIGNDETFGSPTALAELYMTGTTTLEDVDIDLGAGGQWHTENAVLRLNDAEVTLGDSSGAAAPDKPVIFTNSNLDGADFRFDFTPGAETHVCGVNYGQRLGTGELFEILLEGTTASLSNVSLEGNFCYDRPAVVAESWGDNYFEFTFDPPYNGYAEYQIPEDLITVRMNADTLALGGSIINDGVVDFGGEAGDPPKPVSVNGHVTLGGTGGWLGPQQYQGTNPGVADRLAIGEGQTLIGAGFVVSESSGNTQETSLLIDNRGALLSAAFDYDDDLFAGLDTMTAGPALEAVRQPLVAMNRGVIEPSGVIGGGRIDNREGIFAVGETPANFKNASIVGGELILHHFKRGWLRDEFEEIDPGALGVTVFNTTFDGVTLKSPSFVPFEKPVTSFDLYSPGSQGLMEFDASDFVADGTQFFNGNNLFRDLVVKTHASLPAATFRGTLTVDPGVMLEFKDATFGADFQIESSGEDPDLQTVIIFENVTGEPGSSLRIGTEVPVFVSSGLSGIRLRNDGVLGPKPIVDINAPQYPDDLLFMGPGLGQAGSTDWQNRGTITNVSPDGEVPTLQLLGGTIDNRDGEIQLGGDVSLYEITIEGGEIRAAPGEFPILHGIRGGSGAGSPDSTSILRDVRLVDVELAEFEAEAGELILDEVEMVTTASTATTIYHPVEVRGTLTLTGDGQPGTDFIFNQVPYFDNPARDMIRLSAGTEVEFPGGFLHLDWPVASLENEGTMRTGDLLIETPLLNTGTFLDYQTTEVGAPDAPFGETVTLESLGLTSDLEVRESSRVVNHGTLLFSDADGVSDGILAIREALLDNEGGTLDFPMIDVADALVRNTGGIVRASTSLELFNAVVIGGLLESPSLVIRDQFADPFLELPDGDELFGESITSLQDVTINTTSIDLQEATWLCVGEVAAPGAAMTSTGVLSVTGTETELTLASLQNEGVISLNGGTLALTAGFTGSGEVTGGGTLEVGGNFEVGGIVAPGFSAGQLSFVGDPDLLADTVLAFELGGLESGTQHDVLEVETSQPLVLDGSLEISLLDEFLPQNADAFTVLTSDHPLESDPDFPASGTRIAVEGGGSMIAYYGTGSPYDPNHLVLTGFLTYRAVFVAAGATGSEDGSSWADAFVSLQDALAMVPEGFLIHVAAGTYYPDEGSDQTDNLRSSTFQLANGVEILGGFPPAGGALFERDPAAHLSILSGDLQQDDPVQADNAFHVVTGTGTDATAVLDGFVVRDGFADQPTDRHHLGAGILCDFSGSPTFRNLVVRDNDAWLVGGGAYLNAASPTFFRVSFEANRTPQSGASVVGEGAGLYLNASNASFTNCRFLGNDAAASGGALSLHVSDVDLTNVLFSGNHAAADGGAIYGNSNSTFTMVNGTLSGNRAIGVGGAIDVNGSTPVQVDNTIFWNNADGSGAASPTNSAAISSGAAVFSNSLIEFSGGSGTWVPAFGSDGGSNLDVDPIFLDQVDPASAPTTDGDYRLSSASPALDVGHNNANPEASDLAGKARVFGGIIDLGAYEGGYTSFASLHPGLDPLGDANNNGINNFLDYAAGADPTATAGPGLTVAQDRFTLRRRPHGTDLVRQLEGSLDLIDFVPLTEGRDYEVIERREFPPARIEIELRPLAPWDAAPAFFLRESVIDPEP